MMKKIERGRQGGVGAVVGVVATILEVAYFLALQHSPIKSNNFGK